MIPMKLNRQILIKKLKKNNSFIVRIAISLVKKLLYCKGLIRCLSLKRYRIKNNKITFLSHMGTQYSCNPKYICEYLLSHYSGKFEIVWAFDNPKSFQHLKKRGITLTRCESWVHMYHMITSKVIITNVDLYRYYPTINNQIVLNTWHGGGSYKTCGFMNPLNLTSKKREKEFKELYSKNTLYLSSSKAFSEQTIRKSRLFEGEILEIGMPRNDFLINQNNSYLNDKVKNYFGIDSNTRIALYAPTYRNKAEWMEFEPLDSNKVAHALKVKFGGEWIILFRAHHLSVNSKDFSASDYPDMQELLYVADVLITDYSSSIWDFSLMHKPVFLYCPDLSKYTSSRNFYLPIEEWPFILCENNYELEEKIINYDFASYEESVIRHHMELGKCETGKATEIICERIYKECFCGKL